MADFNGGPGGDVFTGGSESDRIYGNGGDDTLSGGGGQDVVSGGAGADTVDGGAGNDIIGSVGITFTRLGLGMGADIPDWDMALDHDVLTGGADDDILAIGYGDDADGGTGYDRLRLSFGGLAAGTTFDTAALYSGQPLVLGGGTIQNIDLLTHLRGTEFADTLILATQAYVAPYWEVLNVDAGAGDDEIRSGASPTKILGGAGNDLLISGTGADSFDGGAGTDTVDYHNYASGILASGGSGPDGDVLSNVENIIGTAFADYISGGLEDNVLSGGGGDDQLFGREGDDTLNGGEGNDILVGGLPNAEAGDDTYNGGGGIDTVDFSGEPGPVAVNLHATLSLTIGSASTSHPYANGPLGSGQALDSAGNYESLTSIENLIMTNENEDVQGSDEANRIEARGGHDRVLAQGGDDVVLAGAGADFVSGGDGNDTLEGGDGQDTLYGENGNDTLRGQGGNDLLRGGAGVDTFDGGADDLENGPVGIWGDVISFLEIGATQGAVADLRTGIISNDGFGNAETMTGIESIEGDTAYVDTFHGNDGRNLIIAGRGDTVYAYGADDRVELRLAAALADGGAGTDLLKLRSDGGFVPDSGGDGIADGAGPGTAGWFVNLSTGVLRDGLNNFGTVANFENVEGSDLVDIITGNAAANTLLGLGGDDVLNGAGGADRMEGGLGNDSYTVDNAGDVVVEVAGEGSDTVATFINYTLGANLENLQAANLASTTGLKLTGNGVSNFIWGTKGSDVIDGAGGVDYMIGGTGSDTYYVDDTGDLIYEQPTPLTDGRDFVVTDVSYTLPANVEFMQARFVAGTAPLALAGNDLDNSIWANAGNNVINGGAGEDFMAGFAGDDLYFVDNSRDRTYEEANGGTDTVATVISYSLLTFSANVENLQAANIAGTDPLALTGNDLRNFIWATQGDNVIDGLEGGDVMIGYGGNDLYFVDNSSDLVVEEAGRGTDTVATYISYTLDANVENLQAANIGASDPLTLFGNEQANFIWGTQGNNLLAGRGGVDHLYGYAGADQFLFNTAAGDANFDYLDDFQAGTDRILLDNSVFTGLADGALPASAFVTGTAALDADDRIIFNPANGGIFYDADGSGAISALLIAVIPVGQSLTAADFLVI
ncbi:MAG TPA: calcium-binding protein [Allosphingosinicella sp.]|jgi:Ca2+-binding RTX toxin-like protein